MTFEKSDLELSPFDVADYLDTPEMQSEYLSAALETGDPACIKKALAPLVRAHGMTATAKSADVTRQGLHKALSEGGDPRLSTLLGILATLNLRLSTQPVA
jgi:probable addiction module antidote protein